ncbi:MAG: hypothetical protein AAF719_00770 [Pseudomonadota bacterium]
MTAKRYIQSAQSRHGADAKTPTAANDDAPGLFPALNAAALFARPADAGDKSQPRANAIEATD